MLHKHLLDFTRKYNKEFAIKGYSKLKKAELQQKIESVLNKQRKEIKEEYKKLKMMKAETKPKPAPKKTPVKKPAPKKAEPKKETKKKETKKPTPAKEDINYKKVFKVFDEYYKLGNVELKKYLKGLISNDKLDEKLYIELNDEYDYKGLAVSVGLYKDIRGSRTIDPKIQKQLEKESKNYKEFLKLIKQEPKKAEPKKEDDTLKDKLRLIHKYKVGTEEQRLRINMIKSKGLLKPEGKKLLNDLINKLFNEAKKEEPKPEPKKETKKPAKKETKTAPKKEEQKKEQPKSNKKIDDLVFKIENDSNYIDNFNKLISFLQKTKQNNIFPLELTFAFSQKQNEENFKALDSNPKLFMDFMAEIAKGIKDNNDLKFNILKKYDKKPSNMSVKSQGIIMKELKNN